MGFEINCAPCSDYMRHQDNIERQEALKLPRAWIDHFRNRLRPWLSPDEYFWTPHTGFSHFKNFDAKIIAEVREKTGGCFYDLSLADQCSLLNVKHISTTPHHLVQGRNLPDKLGKKGGEPIEKFAFECFRRMGWQGDWCEGATFHFISSIVGKIFHSQGMNYATADSKNHYEPFDRKRLTADEKELLRASLASISPKFLAGLHDRWVQSATSVSLPKSASGVFTSKMLVDGWKGIGPERFTQVCEQEMKGHIGFGWADLTLFNATTIRFIEVKQTKDKFTQRQAYWIRNLVKPLGWTFEVLQIHTEK